MAENLKIISRGTSRRDYLREYILACVRDNVLSPADLASPDVVHKIVGAISQDLRAVGADVLRAGAVAGVRAIGELLSKAMTKR